MACSPKISLPVKRRIAGNGSGFTLVEMVIVIVLVGIVFAIGGTLLRQMFNSYFSTTDISEADWQGKIAIERMTRELRAIRSYTASDLDTTSGSQIRFMDFDGNGVCFYLSGTMLMRSSDGPSTTCGATNPQPLADNVGSLAFTYWDDTGTAQTATVTSVYYITAAITIAKGDYSGSFRANVWPRNFLR